MSHSRCGSRRRRTRAIVALAGVLLSTSMAWPVRLVAAQGGSGRTVRLAPVSELPASAKRFAIVIGVDDYEDPQITPLAGAGNDASALSAALVEYAGFPKDQVFLLSSSSGERPTRGNILRRLSNLRGVVPKDGLLLVAFSGHGIDRGGKGYLIPSDAQALGDVDLLEETAVSVESVCDKIRATGVGQVIFIVDACRNDPVAGKGDSDNPMSAAFSRGFSFDVANNEVKAFATLYATEVGHRAFEDRKRGRGYFSEALVEGISGKAANTRGEVTLGALVKYLETTVPRRIALEFGPGKKQLPTATIGLYRASELIVSKVAASTAPVATAPAPVVVDPKAVEVELWAAIKESRDAADFEDYLKQYPTGSYTSVARAKIKQLRAAATPVEPAPVRPAPAGGGASAPAARPAATGDTVVDLGGGVRIEMVVVPAGTFEMGSASARSGEDWTKAEVPQHRVTISKPYLLGKYEVTQGQWKAVMGTNPSQFSGNDELPVEQVSWDDCQEFIRRLNAKTGMEFRLPTEAEWEYACRAGTAGDFAGNLDSMGWYYSNSGSQTHPVGQKQPNGWGLYDMHGNVWEWCQDWYDENYYGRSPGTDPTGATGGSGRVGRGGGWGNLAALCRSALRHRYGPGSRYSYLGFRLARSS